MIKLKEITINKYKSFYNPQKILIEDDITCLVGMNESGKTASLECLAKLNYFEEDENFKFNTTYDYPKREYVEFTNSSTDIKVIDAKFEISKDLKDKIEDDLGKGVVDFTNFEYSFKYKANNHLYLGIKSNIKNFLNEKVSEYSLKGNLKSNILKLDKIDDVLDIEIEETNEESEFAGFKSYIESIIDSAYPWDNKLDGYIAKFWIDKYLPKFWYFDDYYMIKGRTNLNHLINNSENEEHEKTTKALLDISGINAEEIIETDDFEEFIAKLEASSNSITDQIFKYWSTNSNLDIEFKIDNISKTRPGNPQNYYFEKILDIRVRNQKHRITLPLDKRSKGFNWFFSFVAWFSKINSNKENTYILLFDEPGLHLHAKAQADLLRFLNDLSKNYQIIYTTHSPFMIETDKLERVRTIVEGQESSIISDSVQEKDPNTLFPLQAALGYDIAQNLYISKNNLLVEGPADLLYLTFFTNMLSQDGRTGLDLEKITIVPTGGLDKVATFISLLRGQKLNIVCLLDTFIDARGKQKLDDMIQYKIIKGKNIRFFDEFLDDTYKKADIEDLFVKDDYIKIFNDAFTDKYNEVKSDELNDDINNILLQIHDFLDISKFNHYTPAYKLMQMGVNKTYFSEDTLNNFEKVFIEINKLF